MSLIETVDHDGPDLLKLYRTRDHVSRVKMSISVRPGLMNCGCSAMSRNFGFRCTTGATHPTGSDTDRQLV